MVRYSQGKSLRDLFSKGQPMVFTKKEVVLGNEFQPDGIYYINFGYVKVYSIRDDGEENLHIIYGPGEIFPLIWAYIDIHPDGLFYEALGECQVWRVSKSLLGSLLKTNLDFSYDMSVQLARQFQLYMDRVDNLEYKRASERVAYRLLLLASRFGIKHRHGVVIDAPITQEQFANSINLARESATRELNTLESLGIIKLDGRRFVIKDFHRLSSRLTRPANFANWNLKISEKDDL